jgi:hypothetical protein
VSDEALKWLKRGPVKLPVGTSVYQVVVTSRKGILTARVGATPRAFHYHQTTLLKDAQNRIAVFDPILFPDPMLHGFGEFLSKINLDDSIQFAVIRR